ncbi:tetratricopeptide repeat protein [Acinetobacter sp. YH12239]|uniref:tetratricopeptide repeat protein n=1 Tax=Acinetobacter sp. YH12239 TaxID=2601166 RepID=UPI0015D213BF|nr:tetratricopeptide repeat protein [Acinetobacter sp. YH12239]
MKFSFVVLALFVIVSCSSSNLNDEDTLKHYQKSSKDHNYQQAYDALLKLNRSKKYQNYATNELGSFYEHGFYVKKDLNKALELYSKAGNQKYIPAMYNVARIRFDQGKFSEAKSILENIKDYAPALNLLGIIYENGNGTEIDVNIALDYFTQAAQKGNADAQFNLGQVYYQSDLVKKDDEKARHWYELSAEQGYTSATLQLATMYARGDGVEENYSKAIELIKPLAEAGHADAIYNIRFYYKNINDLSEYHQWDQKCAETVGC